MMETKEATMERLIEERSDLKNHLKKMPIWVDDHVTRLNWDREQFESLILDLETRIDQLKCVVEMQSGQLSAYANRGTQGMNELLLPRHLNPNQAHPSMDGAQGLFPGGRGQNHSSYSARPTFPPDVPDDAAPSYSARARVTFGEVPDDAALSYSARARVSFEANDTIELFPTEVQGDDLDLNMFSDSVEEYDLKEG